MNGVRVVALVPARAGSKGIPGKNMKPLLGRPLIDYTLGHAFADPAVDLVAVTTDSYEITARAAESGAFTIRRPAELADDLTPDLPVFQHALAQLAMEGVDPTFFVHLRPTSPFRPRGGISRAVQLARESAQGSSVRSVTVASQNPFKMWTMAESGQLEPLFERVGDCVEPYSQPRQLLPAAYWQTAVIDVIPAEAIRRGSMIGARVMPIDLGTDSIVDLDTEDDWARAEALAPELLNLLIHERV